MTDKKIMIDGVDVSGCECYSKHREGYCGWHTPCEGDTCPYKLKWALQQLKRKEQECDMWKKLTVDNGAVALKYQQQLQAKEQECEELKKNHKWSKKQ